MHGLSKLGVRSTLLPAFCQAQKRLIRISHHTEKTSKKVLVGQTFLSAL